MNHRAVVIGASAGALEALSAILPALPRDYPLPVLVVVHLPPDKKSVLAELLRAKCSLDVREAEDKEPIAKGVVYIAPPDYHLQVEPDLTLSLSNDEPVLYSRPSIDVLFQTAADAYGEGLIGVALTGANNDGAMGLKAIAAEGGTTIIQCPDSAYAAAMPQAALQACPGSELMTLPQIASYLREAATPCR